MQGSVDGTGRQPCGLVGHLCSLSGRSHDLSLKRQSLPLVKLTQDFYNDIQGKCFTTAGAAIQHQNSTPVGAGPENSFPLFFLQNDAVRYANLIQNLLRIREIPIFRCGHRSQATGCH